MEQPLTRLDRETKGLKAFPIFTIFGWLTIMITVLIAVLVLSPTGASYWGDNAKAIRDGAEIGSPLLDQLTTIQWWPKFLVPLAILGVASFMTDIPGVHRHPQHHRPAHHRPQAGPAPHEWQISWDLRLDRAAIQQLI